MSVARSPVVGPPRHLATVLATACRVAGLDSGDARLLRHFANAVYVVAGVVARIDYGPNARTRSSNAVAVTRWLAHQGFPATEPIDVPSPAEQPVIVEEAGRDIAVTFWRYYPQPDPLPSRDFAALGTLASQLHAIDERPPVALPHYRPLRTLEYVLGIDSSARVLGAEGHQWLLRRVHCLREQHAALTYPLGTGLIHADFYSGNMIYEESLPHLPWRLGDWDGVCIGPREIDLAATVTAPRFGLDDASVTAFADAYGYDIRRWDGVGVLRQIRELSTLPALIRLAATDASSAHELRYRLDSLQRGDTTARWHRQ